MTTKNRIKTGFTLIETVIAVMILALVMGGAYQSVCATARLSQKARLHYIAMHIANNRLERARNYAFYNLPLMADSNYVVNVQGAPDDKGEFRRTTIVTTNVAGNLTKLEVKVQIKDFKAPGTNWWAKNEYESVSTYLTTYVIKPGT